MKIVSCCRLYPTHRPGGMAFVCKDRAEALVKVGHEVHVLTTGMDDKEEEEVLNGVHIHYLPSKPIEYSREYATGCLDFCNELLPDVVHLDSFDVSHPWFSDLSSSVTTACTLHGFSWGAFFTQWNLFSNGLVSSMPSFNSEKLLRERAILRYFKTVIGISLNEQWMLQSLMHIRARLVYNPIHSSFFDNRVIPVPRVPQLLCAAISGKTERGFSLATQAAKICNMPFRICSVIPRELMFREYDKSAALLLPTFYAQGCDLAVAESLVRRRPVIATAVGSYLREATDGIYQGVVTLVPPNDLDALVDAIRNLKPDWDKCNTALHSPLAHASNWLAVIGK